ncbi:hypothetical protein EDB92DRAFT_1816726 [Lactarius akahatsu]|uniref:Uncharacterized protein n=1 Tax=Lactarius akahatsu TaxID=416441 RepID=A0AAD4LJ68_9AGAM|nr:hypothetical protein EDB92DRAFT_1816726 [Lactarius akahatsu]
MCRQFDWQLSAISQISTQLSPFLSGVGQLDVRTFPPSAGGHDDLDTARWIELLRPFDGVERLRVADELVLDIARALQRVTSELEDPELFPALRELFFLGNSREFPDALETIAPFISARQLSERPVVMAIELVKVHGACGEGAKDLPKRDMVVVRQGRAGPAGVSESIGGGAVTVFEAFEGNCVGLGHCSVGEVLTKSSKCITVSESQLALEVSAIPAHDSISVLVYKVTIESSLRSETGMTDVTRYALRVTFYGAGA